MPEFLDNEFYALATTLMIAAGVAALGMLLRQPLIVSFIAVGILVGPTGLGIVHEGGEVELLARMGLTILLFLVGLRLDLTTIRRMGPVTLAVGLGQVIFTAVIGFAICMALGLSLVASIYVGVALTFSSTIIIVKLLSDKREIDALHGRVAVGILIVQDLVVVVAMILLSAFGGVKAQGTPLMQALLLAAKGIGLLMIVGALMRWVLPPLLHWLARSQELLIVFAIAWAMLLASLGAYLGFSPEVGAFVAGISLASTPFRESIGTRLVSLRDFLLLFFFIELGAQLELGLLNTQLLPATVLALFVLIGNPLIVMAIMGYLGYRKRTSLLTGLTMAQISEFSLVLGALGVTLGHLSNDIMGLITLVGVVTFAISSYLILYSHRIYDWLSPWLGIFERDTPYREVQAEFGGHRVDVILFGLGRYGSHIARHLREAGVHILGVDFDPYVVSQWKQHHHHAQYGDAEDPELAASLPLADALWVICTSPARETNLALFGAVRDYGFKGHIALTAHHHHDAEELKKLGADCVLLPFADAAKEAADRLLALGDGNTSRAGALSQVAHRCP